MNYKKEMEKAVAEKIGYFAENQDHTEEEIDEIGHNIPLAYLKSPSDFVRYGKKNSLSVRDMMILMNWADSMKGYLDDIKVSSLITQKEASEYYESVRAATIIVSRINYILHAEFNLLFDVLEKEGRLRMAVKRQAGKVEDMWNTYYDERRRSMERSVWVAIDDHLSITYGMAAPLLEKVFEAIRNFMISKGMRDVEVKARCIVVLLMGKVCLHTYRQLFKDFEEDCGVDFTRCFSKDDLQPMVRQFAGLCGMLGVKVYQGKDGCWESEFNPEDSQRFKWAWSDFMKVIRDDDAMDESARRAIELNPEIEKEYRQIIEDVEAKAFEKNIALLKDKYGN